MTHFSRGDVLLIPFPYTDQTGSKRRPCVVLSSDDYNTRRADIIVAPNTSNLASGQFADTQLSDLSSAGLPKPSVVKGNLGTLQKTLVIRRLGSLSNSDLSKVESPHSR